MGFGQTFFSGALLIVLTHSAVSKTIQTGCSIPIGSKEHFRYQWPLAFKPTGELYPTVVDENNVQKIQIENGAEVLLSCGPNYLKNFGRKEVMSVRCHGASGNFTIMESDATEYPIHKFACDLRVIEEVISIVDGCTDKRWTNTNFGYVDPMEKKAVIVSEACYDMTEGRTIFAHVKLGDKASNYLQKLDKTHLTRRQHPDGRYKIELFRGLHFDEIYQRVREQTHTKRVPHLKIANFIDDTLLSSPQFQAVKKLGWNYYVAHDDLQVLDTLKQDIKKLSETQNVDVYVGTQDIKVFQGNNGEKLALYLQQDEKNRFPMPDLIWILVKSGDKAVVFGVYNEEDSNSIDKGEEKRREESCSDCSKITWITETIKQGRSLICCDYDEFKKRLGEKLPTLPNIKGLLI